MKAVSKKEVIAVLEMDRKAVTINLLSVLEHYRNILKDISEMGDIEMNYKMDSLRKQLSEALELFQV